MTALDDLRKKNVVTDLEYTVLMADKEFGYHAKQYGIEYRAATCEAAAAELAALRAENEQLKLQLAHYEVGAEMNIKEDVRLQRIKQAAKDITGNPRGWITYAKSGAGYRSALLIVVKELEQLAAALEEK